MDYIERSIEDILCRAARGFKVLLVTGSRQVGKSTLLEHLFSEYNRVTFDDPALLLQAKREPRLFMDDNRPPLLLDEVQYIPELFPYIKMDVDTSDAKGQYLLTGSQHFHMMRNISESLAGRVGILELSPLSLREIQGVRFSRHFVPTAAYVKERARSARTCKDVWEVIHRGGYPALQDPALPWDLFFGSYVKTYIERDINQLAKVQDQLKFTQFLTVVAARTATLLNLTNMADELEISVNTVRNWLSLLEATGLVFILQPFTNSALNRAIRTPKLYFRDTGLACWLTRWNTPDTVRNGAMAGALFETFVVSEILKSFSNEGIDYRMRVSYYRGKDKIRRRRNGEEIRMEAEIDLIIEESGLLHPIEIKMTANPKSEMSAAFDVLDRIPNERRGDGAVVCLYDRPLSLRENVRVIPVHYL